jgi:hypothetical protein
MRVLTQPICTLTTLANYMKNSVDVIKSSVNLKYISPVDFSIHLCW